MIVRLQHGLRRGGAWQRTAALAPLTGAAEARLADLPAAAGAAARAHALLDAAILRLGDLPPSRAEVRALTVGDRDRLLLALHRLTFGPRLDAAAACGGRDCGSDLEVEIALDDLLADVPDAVPPDGDPPGYATAIDTDGGSRLLRFRLPTAGDLEAVARLHPGDGAGELFTRCVLSLTDAGGGEADPRSLPPDARRVLGDRMRELDPFADASVRVACPACGHETAVLLDAAALLLPRLGRAADLLEDVHRLARVYHWSEPEILALPCGRRQRYLDLVAAEAEAP